MDARPGDSLKAAAIEVDDLTVRYGQHTALSRVTFSLPTGSFLAVIGPNGSGKSTLVRALLGLIRPTRGRVRILGRPPRYVEPDLVGYVPQIKSLDRSFPALATELVLAGLRHRWPWGWSAASRETALRGLSLVGAGHLATRSLAELSGGELQRVYLARSLVRQPALLLLDEPATGVDPMGAADLFGILERQQKERKSTVMVVTHDWDAARYHSTHVLVLNCGQVAFGPPPDVLSDDRLSAAFGHAGHPHTSFGDPDA